LAFICFDQFADRSLKPLIISLGPLVKNGFFLSHGRKSLLGQQEPKGESINGRLNTMIGDRARSKRIAPSNEVMLTAVEGNLSNKTDAILTVTPFDCPYLI
jgi:hypothetical protein